MSDCVYFVDSIENDVEFCKECIASVVVSQLWLAAGMYSRLPRVIEPDKTTLNQRWIWHSGIHQTSSPVFNIIIMII